MARLMWVLYLLATLALSASAASSPPPASSADCDSVVMDLMDCLPYVSKGSHLSRPGKECCQGVSSVVKASPTCLCAALQEAIHMGIVLDMKRATGLPAACSIKVSVGDCGVPTPPPSVPGPAPSPKPTPAPPKRPPTPTPKPPSPPKSTPTPPPPSKPTPLPPPPPHSPAVPPPPSPPKSSTPPSPSVVPAGPPSLPPAPAPAESEPENESSTARRLPISIMTAMIALVVAACSYLEL